MRFLIDRLGVEVDVSLLFLSRLVFLAPNVSFGLCFLSLEGYLLTVHL
jgi:hypothetical protein